MNLDQMKKKMNLKTAKPKSHEDLDGVVKTRRASILIDLQDEIMQIQEQMSMEKSLLNGLKMVSPSRR